MSTRLSITPFGWFVLQALGILSLAWEILNLRDFNLEVPLHYRGDALIFLMYLKALLINGWPLEIPQLSAPFSLSGPAFPIATSFDWLLMKLLSLFTDQVGRILNLFWLLSLILSGGAAMLALRFLNIQPFIAAVLGVLYAFLPYALLRNVDHLNLVYYLVPLLATLTVYIACNRQWAGSRWPIAIMLLACVAQGFNYIYYSFFAVILFAFAGAYGGLRYHSSAPLKLAALAIALIIAATAANLAPSFEVWQHDGQPPEMDFKYPAEAEVYGLKLRRLLAPHPDNPIPFMADWGKADITARFPNENENLMVRLGPFAAVGLMILLLVVLGLFRTQTFSKNHAQLLEALAALTLLSLLLTSVGGFGALFNLLIASDIRAYNRFSVFIAFFSLAGIALILQGALAATRTGPQRNVLLLLFLVAAGYSLYDQLLDRQAVVAGQRQSQTEYAADKAFMQRFAEAYPKGAMTLQLPLTEFPPLSIHSQMESYEHIRPFLFATAPMRWSWPSLSQQHRSWQDRIAGLSGRDFVAGAVYSGFGTIWINRSAYPDGGQAVAASLQQARAEPVLKNDRYLVLDLERASQEMRDTQTDEAFARNVREWLDPVALRMHWSSGFYAEERTSEGEHFRWSQRNSRLVITNPAAFQQVAVLSFELASQATGRVTARAGDQQWLLSSSPRPTSHEITFGIPAGSSREVVFETTLAPVYAPNDPRELYFHLKRPRMEAREATRQR
jgi:phosphoglycerol transferase